MTRSFAITFDYRCPYARIAHEHVLTGLDAGADWQVEFVPFCLGQVHVAEGDPPVWQRPDADSGLLALQAAIAVRDRQPEHFRAVHRSLFDHRHVDGGDLRGRDVLSAVLATTPVDVDAVWAEVDNGAPLTTVEKEHTGYAQSHNVWGVPTFVVDDRAVFVRLLDTSDGDESVARRTVDRILDEIDWPLLNEFKHTSIPR